MCWKFKVLLLMHFAMASPSTAQVAETPVTPFALSGKVEVTQVTDGDSFRSGKLKIRLFGIDAPELKQQCETNSGALWSCGLAARDAIRNLVDSTQQLNCHLHDVDHYGRLVMQCFANGQDIAAALVDQGLALAYRNFSKAYEGNEKHAAAAGHGMWQGRFSPPWKWRRK